MAVVGVMMRGYGSAAREKFIPWEVYMATGEVALISRLSVNDADVLRRVGLEALSHEPFAVCLREFAN